MVCVTPSSLAVVTITLMSLMQGTVVAEEPMRMLADVAIGDSLPLMIHHVERRQNNFVFIPYPQYIRGPNGSYTGDPLINKLEIPSGSPYNPLYSNAISVGPPWFQGWKKYAIIGGGVVGVLVILLLGSYIYTKSNDKTRGKNNIHESHDMNNIALDTSGPAPIKRADPSKPKQYLDLDADKDENNDRFSGEQSSPPDVGRVDSAAALTTGSDHTATQIPYMSTSPQQPNGFYKPVAPAPNALTQPYNPAYGAGYPVYPGAAPMNPYARPGMAPYGAQPITPSPYGPQGAAYPYGPGAAGYPNARPMAAPYGNPGAALYGAAAPGFHSYAGAPNPYNSPMMRPAGPPATSAPYQSGPQQPRRQASGTDLGSGNGTSGPYNMYPGSTQ